MLAHFILSICVGVMVFGQAVAAQTKIAVVGAGLSGLTTAYRVQQAGFDVDVYEARPRVGGRVHSVNVDGRFVEMGGQNIYDGGEGENMFRLIAELGLETEVASLPIDIYSDVDSKFVSLKQMIAAHDIDSGRLWPRLEEFSRSTQNMQELLQRLFPEDVLLRETLGFMLAGFEGGAPRDLDPRANSGALYYMLTGGISFVHQTDGFENPAIEHAWVQGGNQRLAEALAARLGKRVHLEHQLERVHKGLEKGYRLVFANGQVSSAEILVLTVPTSVFSDIHFEENIIAADKLAKMESIKYGTNAKIVVPLDAEPNNLGQYTNRKMVSYFPGQTNQISMYYADKYGKFTTETVGETFKRDFPVVQRGYKLRDKPLTPTFVSDVPGQSYSGPVAYSWPNDPFVKGSYTYVAAGQKDLFTAVETLDGEMVKTLFVPLHNTLFFAGEHTTIDEEIIGTMEAAVESGERTARMIIRYQR